MNRKEYETKRAALEKEAEALINEGKIEEANAKMDEIKKLDEKQQEAEEKEAEKQAKMQEAMANLTALKAVQVGVNIQNLSGVNPEGLQNATATLQLGLNGKTNSEKEEMYASEGYKTAWAKLMMGKTITGEEAEMVKMVNDFTHTTENTGIVIPKTVAAGIWQLIEDTYPLWDDIQKTYVKGNYSALVENDSTDAKWYDEATETEDGKDTLKEVSLTGCELSRSVTVSWKLREMAIEDFIPYIQRQLARKMGAGMGYGVSHGKGKPSATEFKPEPMGIITALEKESETPQIIKYKAGALKYADFADARARLTVGAKEAKVYANNATIWSEIATILDTNKRPIMVPDPVNGSVNRILGMEVKQDDSMKDGEILISSPFIGYIANVNKDMSVMTEEHVKLRKVDYCGYAIVDGAPTTTKAHVLLKHDEG
nr:MAG TPA_asm: major capsid protein [Caudoviricetes sp.]